MVFSVPTAALQGGICFARPVEGRVRLAPHTLVDQGRVDCHILPSIPLTLSADHQPGVEDESLCAWDRLNPYCWSLEGIKCPALAERWHWYERSHLHSEPADNMPQSSCSPTLLLLPTASLHSHSVRCLCCRRSLNRTRLMRSSPTRHSFRTSLS